MKWFARPARPARTTRRGELGPKAWLLPIAVLVPAVLMTALAVDRVDRVYRHDGGVLQARQLLPAAPLNRIGHDDTGPERARRLALEKRWHVLGRTTGTDVATTSWPESTGRDGVVLVARSANPSVTAAGWQRRSVRSARVVAWAEGERYAIAVVLTASGPRDDPAAVLAVRQRQIRTAESVQRAFWLTTVAALPVISVVTLVTVGLLAFVLVAGVAVLVFAGPVLLWRRRRRRSTGAPPPAPTYPGLLPGVQVVQASMQRQRRVSVLRVVPLVVVALPAAARSLWPASLYWAAVLALLSLLAMRWARGWLPVRVLRWVLYAALAVGLAHVLIDLPSQNPTDQRYFGPGLAVVAALAVALALLRRRMRGLPTLGAGVRGARWLVMLLGFVVLAASSAAVFLGSNGEPDVRAQLFSKLVAIPGLVAIPLAARRLRAARTSAEIAALRRQDKPEVLYLRSFIDDRLRVRSPRTLALGLGTAAAVAHRAVRGRAAARLSRGGSGGRHRQTRYRPARTGCRPRSGDRRGLAVGGDDRDRRGPVHLPDARQR